jgi:hypothetical protein
MLDGGSGDRRRSRFTKSSRPARSRSDIGADAAMLTITARRSPAGAEDAGRHRPAARRSGLRASAAVSTGLTQLRACRRIADRAFVVSSTAVIRMATPLGSERSLTALTVDDVRAFHRAIMRPADATLVVVGDCVHADAWPLPTPSADGPARPPAASVGLALPSNALG